MTDWPVVLIQKAYVSCCCLTVAGNTGGESPVQLPLVLGEQILCALSCFLPGKLGCDGVGVSTVMMPCQSEVFLSSVGLTLSIWPVP